MKKIDDKILGAVKVKQLVSQVSKIDSVRNFWNSVLICPKGQTTWNADCADDADAHGYDHQNPRVSAQSAASAFNFRFDDYFINPKKQNYNSPQSTQSLAAFSLHSGTEKNQQRTQRTRNELTLPEFVLVRTSSLFFSYSFMNDNSRLTLRRDLESKNFIESRCENESLDCTKRLGSKEVGGCLRTYHQRNYTNKLRI